jgi:hypothetical protein
MGTRCLTVINDHYGKEIAVLYRQFDGYPEGHGTELKAFLSGKRISNGIMPGCFNGMECLAASVVANFKTAPGGFYLYRADTRDIGEEFVYTIYPTKETTGRNHQASFGINLRVQSGAVAYFGNPGTKQADMPVVYDGPVSDFKPA